MRIILDITYSRVPLSSSKNTGEEQRISPLLFTVYSAAASGFPSVALFRCDSSIGTFFRFIRVYTGLFSDLNISAKPFT